MEDPRTGLAPLPDRVAVSVVTIGELELGVLASDDGDVLARRAETLARERHPIPISEAVVGVRSSTAAAPAPTARSSSPTP